MSKLLLLIRPGESTPGWRGTWYMDDQQVGDRVTIDGTNAEAMGALGKGFLELFERDVRPLRDAGELRGIGQDLFDAWFGPVWPLVVPKLRGVSHHLLIRSTSHDLLNLPWELIELAPDLPVGCDPGWSLCRSPLEGDGADEGTRRPGPLRILFLTAAPTDLSQLDYEREEDAMLQATARLQNVILHFAESGTFDELKDLVQECRPHVVHLSGHGSVGKDGQGGFAFEDERGKLDNRNARDIVNEVFRGDEQVRCVFFNGCRTSQAASAGLCQSLVESGIPIAVGWSASVHDDRATDFTAEFYRGLVRNLPVPIAAAHGRQAIRKKGEIKQGDVHKQDATFALPQVYAPATDGILFDKKLPPEPYTGPQTTYGPLGHQIVGLREGFIGRRRELQRLVPALREGETTFAVITGLGGTGKSTLSTRVANRLKSAGFQTVAVRARKDDRGPRKSGETLVADVIKALDVAFLRAGRQDLHGQITDVSLPLGQRLQLAVEGLNELRFVVVIDNFEDTLLDLKTLRIADEGLAEFYRLLATDLVGGSRAVVTCRYLPATTPTDQPNVLHLPLNEFKESEYQKFLRRDEVVEARISEGKLSRDLLHDLYGAFGGTPRFLEDVRTLLRTADPVALRAELKERVSGKPGDESKGVAPGQITRAWDDYHGKVVITSRLYDALSPDDRAAVSRLAVSLLPLPAEAAGPILRADEGTVSSRLESWVSFGLIQRFDEPDLPPLYHPPGLLRPWLSSPDRLPSEEARDVHRHLAAFWKSSYEADREATYRVSIDAELTACRAHARSGDDFPTFRWATARLAYGMHRRGEWASAQALLEEISDADHDTDSLQALARVEVSLGEWKSSRWHLERAHETLDEDTAEKATTWHNLATVDLREGDYPAAREKFAKALAINQAIGDRAGEAATWHQLASVDLNEGDYPAAREKFAKALATRQAIGDRAGEAATWHNLASVDLREGDYPAAREKFARALAINQAIGDRAGEAATWHNLASVDLNEGDYPAAREKFAKALAINQAIGDRAGEAATWHSIATVDLNEGDYPAAREKFAKALATRQAIGDRAGEAATWHQLASVDLNEGDYPAAREKFAKALATRQAIGDRAGEAATWHQLASVDLNEGDYPAAREKFARALAINQAIGDRAGEAATWHNLASVDLREGDYPAAREKLAKALAIMQAIGDRAGEAAIWHNLATVDLNEGDYPAAREKFARALATRQAIGDRAGEAATWHQLASVDLNEGDYPAAREKFARALAILQAIGDRAGEAAIWHNLASVDLREGDYPAAREKFAKALTILQAIGDRAGEASTLYQLGVLAYQMGNGHDGARLVAICALIDQAIGHGDTKSDFRNLSKLCAQLGYDQAQYAAMMSEAAQALQSDRGRALIERAFAGEMKGEDGGTRNPPGG